MEQFGAGPFGSLFFVDAGAEVIKIEDPAGGGDVGRYVPPVASGTTSLYFETFNRGKRSIALNLKHPDGRWVFERLVESADAVFNNLRGDLPAALGLTYDALSHINPRIVCASLSAYGQSGRRASEPGYDALIQAEAGWAMLTGAPGGPPVKSGLSLVDYAAGTTIAFGLAAALFQAQRTGRGCDVETSLYDVALSLLSYPATWQLSAGIETPRMEMSAHPSIVPFQFFDTANGHTAVACAKEKFFTRLIELIDLPELGRDSAFADFEHRRTHRKALHAKLGERFVQEPTEFWIDRLRGQVPCAPVRTMKEALAPDELIDRGMLAEYEHPNLGTVRTVGSPLMFDESRASPLPGPELDADRVSILCELGLGDDEIRRLELAGAFGWHHSRERDSPEREANG
ncbi:MAG: CoA transferase [Thermomicrobiales bacterium]|nr:CoA transferase [Thermomicrobiales bacterium]